MQELLLLIQLTIKREQGPAGNPAICRSPGINAG